MNSDSLYYFDVQRTLHEAYAHAWELLHQVNQEELTASISNSLRQYQQVGVASAMIVGSGEEEEAEEDSITDNSTTLQHNQTEL